MTVKELMDALQMFRADAEILVSDRSGYDALLRMRDDESLSAGARIAAGIVAIGGFEKSSHDMELAEVFASPVGPTLIVTQIQRK